MAFEQRHLPALTPIVLVWAGLWVGCTGPEPEVLLCPLAFDRPSQCGPAVCTSALERRGTVAIEVRDIVVSGSHAYVSDDLYGFRVLDVSDPSHPTQVGGLVNLIGFSRGLHLSGDTLYLAGANAGVLVLNVADPAEPTLIGSIDLPGYTRDIFVEETPGGDVAWVADDFEGFRVLDLSDPAHPRQLAELPDVGQPALRVEGDRGYAFLAAGPDGLLIIDVSVPTEPALVASLDTAGHTWDLALAGTVAYLADDVAGIVAVDVADPLNPFKIGQLDTPGHARAVRVAGHLLFVADGSRGLPPVPPDPGGFLGRSDGEEGLRIIDISDPTMPFERAAVGTEGYALMLTIDGQTAYVGAAGAGMQVFDVADPDAPQSVGAFVEAPGLAVGVALDGSRAILADGWAGVRVIDIEDADHPREVGRVKTPGDALGALLHEGTTWVADSSGALLAIDADAAGSARIAHSVALPSPPASLAALTGAVLVAGGDSLVLVIDDAVADVAEIRCDIVASHGAETALVGGQSRITLVEHQASRLVIRSSLDMGGEVTALSMTQQLGLVGVGQRLAVVDLREPDALSLVATLDAPAQINTFVVDGALAFAGVGNRDHEGDGLVTFGLADPTRPILIRHDPLPEPIFDLARDPAGNLYAAAADGGLMVLDPGCQRP